VVGPLEDPSTRRPTAGDQAWDAVLAFVTAAPEGMRLPPERALAERLGVSRSTLRSALSRLELLGHIEVKHGSGIVVRRPSVADMLALVTSATGPSPADALALRCVLEPQLAGLAAERGHAAGLESADDDTSFHTALAASSGNELAGPLVGVLVALSGRSGLPVALHEAQHAAIVAAVAVRDARSAAGATRVHLDAVRRAYGPD
jgi:GntR family transcriptional regulator, transcriptional repressor for pyruvate dehydrogenase complex